MPDKLSDKFDANAAADDETDRSGPPARSVAGEPTSRRVRSPASPSARREPRRVPTPKLIGEIAVVGAARNATAMTLHAPRQIPSPRSSLPRPSRRSPRLTAPSARSRRSSIRAAAARGRRREPEAEQHGGTRGDLGTARLSEIGLNRSSDGPPRTSTNLGAACSGAPGADVRSKCSGAGASEPDGHRRAALTRRAHPQRRGRARRARGEESLEGGESGSPMDRGATRTAAAGGRVSTAMLSVGAASLSTMDDDARRSRRRGSAVCGIRRGRLRGHRLTRRRRGYVVARVGEDEPPSDDPAAVSSAVVSGQRGEVSLPVSAEEHLKLLLPVHVRAMFKNPRCAEMDMLLRLAAAWYALLPPLPPALTLRPSSR